MRGVVTSYNRQKCAGIITADDGKEYTISRYDIDGLPVPERDDIVDFEPDDDKATDSVPIISKFLLIVSFISFCHFFTIHISTSKSI